MRWRKGESADAGRGWQSCLSADSAAESRATSTFSERLNEVDRVKERKMDQGNERERETHKQVRVEMWEVQERRQVEKRRAVGGGKASCCIGQR